MSEKKEDKKIEVDVNENDQETSNLEEVENSSESSEISKEEEIEALKAKVAELEEKYLRAHAEFENLKKRLEKEKATAVAYANELFARDMLSIIDALDSAANIKESKEVKPEELFEKIKEGIDLTVEQFKKAFEKHGIELIDVSGEFDPNIHEAVMQVDSEEKDSGEILQVFQKGYKIKDRVLRPAMVSIAK